MEPRIGQILCYTKESSYVKRNLVWKVTYLDDPEVITTTCVYQTDGANNPWSIREGKDLTLKSLVYSKIVEYLVYKYSPEIKD